VAGEDDGEGQRNQQERREHDDGEHPAVELQMHVVERHENRLDRGERQDEDRDAPPGQRQEPAGDLGDQHPEEHQPGQPDADDQVGGL